jgi:NAD-dependent SIR2 family protein deacetylase
MNDAIVRQARSLLHKSDALLIAAGAGMGVDSGLPDFRGTEGFWRAYPAARRLGLRFEELANPHWFEADPALAWAFYGHRLHAYRDTEPHEGFARLLQLAKTKPFGAFVATSNVDGQFQKAGFDPQRIVEIHGSIHHLQCVDNCQGAIWSAQGIAITIDDAFRAHEPLPRCQHCEALARPNILMFGDGEWESARTDAQSMRFEAWLAQLERAKATLAVVEIGAGTAIPTIRRLSETIASRFGTDLIRINPREAHGAPYPLAAGAREAIAAITLPTRSRCV